ncbi:MAG: site-2 protease family protein [Solirubrobacteraceae bacterium]
METTSPLLPVPPPAAFPPPAGVPPSIVPQAHAAGLGTNPSYDGAPLEQRKPSLLRRKLGAAGATLLALLTKLKALLLLLPKFKLLTTAGTMAVSIVAYASIWGFAFAAGFVVLLLVHELGHVIALRREGIKASAPMFVPFLGAVISARSLGDNALAEARVGLAGPVLGTIGSAACLVVWHLTGSEIWRALAYTGFLLNLFNLLPVVPLDGGRAMAAMAPWMWGVGFAGLVALAIIFPNPIIFLILIIGGMGSYRRWQRRRRGGALEEAYYRVAAADRARVAAVYVGLLALLVIGMHTANLPRTIV